MHLINKYLLKTYNALLIFLREYSNEDQRRNNLTIFRTGQTTYGILSPYKGNGWKN